MKHLIVALILGFSSAAFAQTAPQTVPVPAVKPEERQAVSLLLRAIHELPARAEFEAVSNDPYAVVVSIAQGSGPIAERAVEAMFLWPTDQTFALAQAQLADPATKSGRRHRLLMLLADTYQDRATTVVAPYLTHTDARLRITAAAALAKIRTDAAFAQLDDAVALEKNEAVAAEMRRYARRVR